MQQHHMAQIMQVAVELSDHDIHIKLSSNAIAIGSWCSSVYIYNTAWVYGYDIKQHGDSIIESM